MQSTHTPLDNYQFRNLANFDDNFIIFSLLLNQQQKKTYDLS